MSFCPVDSCSISIVYLIMSITYFNADILENSFSNVISLNELGCFQRLLLLCFPVVLMLFSGAIQLHIYSVHNFFLFYSNMELELE